MYINQKQDPHLGLPLFMPVHTYRTATRAPHFIPVTEMSGVGVSERGAIGKKCSMDLRAAGPLFHHAVGFALVLEPYEAKSRCRSRLGSRALPLVAGSL